MPGHLDVVEGLKPSRANLPLADPRGGVTKSPALLSDVLLLTSFLFSMCFYYCLRILASEHMSESKGAATPNLPSYLTKLVRRVSVTCGIKHCKTKLLRKLLFKSV